MILSSGYFQHRAKSYWIPLTQSNVINPEFMKPAICTSILQTPCSPVRLIYDIYRSNSQIVVTVVSSNITIIYHLN